VKALEPKKGVSPPGEENLSPLGTVGPEGDYPIGATGETSAKIHGGFFPQGR